MMRALLVAIFLLPITLFGQKPPVPIEEALKSASTDPVIGNAILNYRLNELIKRVDELQKEERAFTQNAKDALFILGANDGLKFAASQQGLRIPIRFASAESVPNGGIKYSFEIINIYSVNIINPFIMLEPYYVSRGADGRELFPTGKFGAKKNGEYSGQLKPGRSCLISVILPGEIEGRPMYMLNVSLSTLNLQWTIQE